MTIRTNALGSEELNRAGLRDPMLPAGEPGYPTFSLYQSSRRLAQPLHHALRCYIIY
jgi:hypothetical protein